MSMLLGILIYSSLTTKKFKKAMEKRITLNVQNLKKGNGKKNNS